MAQSPDAVVLQPIIKRSLSPNTAISNSVLKSPQFSPDPPSPNLHRSPQPATTSASSQSYFFQSHSHSHPDSIAHYAGGERIGGGKDTSVHGQPAQVPPTPGILLNKNDSTTLIRERPHSPPILQQPEPLMRVASPAESNSNVSDSGFSSDGGFKSPPPALGSPVLAPSSGHAKPTLDALVTAGAGGADIKRTTSPPSPHCHFAPLPKPEERPQSRRSSIVSGRVKPFIPRPPERSDTVSTMGGDDEALSTGEYTPTLSPTAANQFFHPSPSTSSAEHFTALSQRLSSSLTFAAPTARHPSSPSRPTSRRSSSSRRSRSPSPPGFASRGSDHHAHHHGHSHGHHSHHRDRTPSTSSRTHSPNLSRRPSTDALSLHYIEAGAEGGGGGRAVNLSRQNSRAGSERGGDDVLTMSSSSSSQPPLQTAALRRPQSSERRSTFDVSVPKSGGTTSPLLASPATKSIDSSSLAAAATPSPPPPPPPPMTTTPPETGTTIPATMAAVTSTTAMIALHNGSGMMLVDRDKEADLHRLVDKAQHGNVDAERAVSPALLAQQNAKREREREAGGGTAVARGRTGHHGGSDHEGSAVQVVEVGRVDERDEPDELEEVKEEEEDGIDEDEDDEDEDDDDEEEEEEEDGNGDTEEDDDDEERDRSRDDDEDDEEEEEPAEERKTSKGAAVEVVRWHRDDPPPASQVSSVDPTPSIPEDSIAEQEAEEQSAVEESQAAAVSGSRTPSNAFVASTSETVPAFSDH